MNTVLKFIIGIIILICVYLIYSRIQKTDAFRTSKYPRVSKRMYYVKLEKDTSRMYPRIGYPKGKRRHGWHEWKFRKGIQWGKWILPKIPGGSTPWKNTSSFKKINNNKTWKNMYGWTSKGGYPPQEAICSLHADKKAVALMYYDSPFIGGERWFKTNIPYRLLINNILYNKKDKNEFKIRQKVIFKRDPYGKMIYTRNPTGRRPLTVKGNNEKKNV